MGALYLLARAPSIRSLVLVLRRLLLYMRVGVA